MSTADFYNRMAPWYRLLFPDWVASVQRQAEQLDSVIREYVQPAVKTILDASCGIGTQSIGLAQKGYQVTASDISADSIARAREESARRGLSIPFTICDFRRLAEAYDQTFDLVIACDNSIPHLLSDDDIRTAFGQMLACSQPGGACLISVRDYETMSRTGIEVQPDGERHDGDTRYEIFQVRRFEEDPDKAGLYDVAMYFIEDRGEEECRTRIMRSRYYAITISRLLELMREAGWPRVERIDGRYFQPLILAQR